MTAEAGGALSPAAPVLDFRWGVGFSARSAPRPRAWREVAWVSLVYTEGSGCGRSRPAGPPPPGPPGGWAGRPQSSSPATTLIGPLAATGLEPPQALAAPTSKSAIPSHAQILLPANLVVSTNAEPPARAQSRKSIAQSTCAMFLRIVDGVARPSPVSDQAKSLFSAENRHLWSIA